MSKIFTSQKCNNTNSQICQRSFFVLVFLFIAAGLAAQWNTQSPYPTYLDVRGVGAPNEERVFIATNDNSFDDSGALFESNDGGETWVQRDIPFSLNNPLNGLFFLDNLHGWTYGNENYRTSNGGTTWTEMPFLGSTYFMEFYSTDFGLATGNFGKYVSYDGGDSWVESPFGIFKYNFVDELNGLGASDTALFRTTDGGNNFTQVYTGNAKTVTFLSNTKAVAIVDDTLFFSVDGGYTWAPSTGAEGRNRLFRISDNIVLAWGRGGSYPDFDDRVFRSEDGGQSWTDMGEISTAGVFTFTQVTGTTAVAAMLNGDMYYSADAGSGWALSYDSPGIQPGYLSSAAPAFADDSTGYFGYGAGFVIKTADGGASWNQISGGSGVSLMDADRFSTGNLIAVGENGTVLTKTETSPWIIRESQTHERLTAVQVIGIDSVVMISESGQLFFSQDGGVNWSESGEPPNNFYDATDLQFANFQEGWVIGFGGSSGALYHTVDGGESWTVVPDFSGAYNAVDVEGSMVWAANVGGNYYMSDDQGVNWTEGDLPGSPHQIQDMEFYNESTGYAVGWWGQVFRSVDGGLNWDQMYVPADDDDFTDIYLTGENEIWLSTNNDRVYYSATGGQNWSVLDIGSAGYGNFSAVVASEDGDAWTVGFLGYIEHFSGPPTPPLNNPPTAFFEFSTVGLTVEFTDTSYDDDGEIVSWEWDFGDSTFSSTQHPVHTFDTANTYIVTLTVTDDDQDTDSYSRAVVVQPGPGGTFGDFTEVTPLDSLFVTPQDEDFWVISTAPADVDNDGDLDIAVLGYYVVYNVSVHEKLVVLRNEGQAATGAWDFTYINVPMDTLSAGASDMEWGDLDADGDLDLVVGTNGETVIFRNDAGSFENTGTILPGYYEDNDQAEFDLRSISLADYDNDGDPDILLPSVFDNETWSYRTSLMRNDGSDGNGGWIFTETDSVFAPTKHAQSEWADFDGDMDLDLLLVNMSPLTDDGFIKRYRNDGNGEFVEEEILGSLKIEHGEARWGDYDNDEDLDILVAGLIQEPDSLYPAMSLRVYQNDNGIYSPLEVIDCIPCEGWFDITAATWADYDSDGDMDILVAGNYNSGTQIEGRARIYTNEGNGIFSDSGNELPAPRASGSRGGTFSWLDIDGEGDLDYFIAGQYFVPGGNGLVEAQMHLYINDTDNPNQPPSAPGGLQVSYPQDNSVMLNWLPSEDDHTPSVALTYNLELYQDDIPVSIPTFTPKPGNVSTLNEWLISGLSQGTYKWLIRAVDASFTSSTVSEGEFVIGMVSTGDDLINTADEFTMEQNYPNPFSESTIIEFSLPSKSKVSFTVFNVMGEEILSFKEDRPSGNNRFLFNAENIPGGIYYYRLQAGNRASTKKMIISK